MNGNIIGVSILNKGKKCCIRAIFIYLFIFKLTCCMRKKFWNLSDCFTIIKKSLLFLNCLKPEGKSREKLHVENKIILSKEEKKCISLFHRRIKWIFLTFYTIYKIVKFINTKRFFSQIKVHDHFFLPLGIA